MEPSYTMELYTEPQHSAASLQSTVTNTQPAFSVYNLPPGTRWVTSWAFTLVHWTWKRAFAKFEVS